jgi:hypothetical protein
MGGKSIQDFHLFHIFIISKLAQFRHYAPNSVTCMVDCFIQTQKTPDHIRDFLYFSRAKKHGRNTKDTPEKYMSQISNSH